MGRLCLNNYYRLIHKANIHLANTNLYKDVVRVHMPRLLEYWANLMIWYDNHVPNQAKSLEYIEEISREES